MSSTERLSSNHLSSLPSESIIDESQNERTRTTGSTTNRASSTTRRAKSPVLQVVSSTGASLAYSNDQSPQPSAKPDKKSDKVSWMSLPHKSQLAILTLARLSEPITQTSLQSYLYHQLASFEPDASRASIATHVGFVVAAFPAAQAFTSVVWGIVADSPRIGRKRVLVIGLFGTAIGTIGYGLSHSWQAAMLWRGVSGVLNGNVGVMRTMISEIVREKKYQSRAFLLMPMCFNIGTVIGPTLGGWLADPVKAYPGVFGPGSFLGGEEGVWWMRRWPYALPNFVSAAFLASAACCVIFGLDETLEARRDAPDWGRSIWHTLTRFMRRSWSRQKHYYSQVQLSEPDTPGHEPTNNESSSKLNQKKRATTPNKLPIRRMWTSNVLVNLLSRFLVSLTVGTFQTLWFTFLSAPRSDDTENGAAASSGHSIFHFSGGLGLPPAQVGMAMAILGFFGITLQLTSYPAISARLGTTRSFRLPLPLFPIICIAIPFLALLPSNSPAPKPMDGPILWISLCLVLSLYVVARTFVLPASAILINNCSPHPSRLGSIHGVAQSFGASARFLGPFVGGAVFGAGDAMGVVGLAWWLLAGVGSVSWVVGMFVKEGSGHEILLQGEKRTPDGEVVYVSDQQSSGDDSRGEPALPARQ